MQRDQALETLRRHHADLAARGVKRLALFGSLARDEARPDSDVDVLVEFADRPAFKGYMGLKRYLEDIFGRPADLATPRSLKPRIKERVEREAVYVA
ncbi:MAG: nucleotidyltransferase family protein [Thermodesulfobacteriota bacterium]